MSERSKLVTRPVSLAKKDEFDVGEERPREIHWTTTIGQRMRNESNATIKNR